MIFLQGDKNLTVDIYDKLPVPFGWSDLELLLIILKLR